MEARELRIGNYVMLKGKLSFIDIPLTMTFAEEMQPIPLTPDILEKAGGLGKCNLVQIGSNYSEEVTYWTMVPNELLGINIKYVHQLQNYHFALTGEELEINI